jgi:hypothetical protein
MSRVSEVEVDKAVDSIRHMSLDDLRVLSDEIALRRNALSRQNMREISVGDQVSFTGRNGGEQTGEVTKKAIKYCTVDTGFGRWKVPASMLTIV